jgi:hypothetical protein
MSIHLLAPIVFFALLLLGGAFLSPAAGQQPGGTVSPTLTPNTTINAQPACRVSRRLLCTVGDGSCGTGGVRRICHSSEKRVQVGAAVYCDKWVCN